MDVSQIAVLLAFYIPKKWDFMSFLYTCTYTYCVILLFVPYKKIYMFWYFTTVVKCIWLCPLPWIRTQFMIIWWGALFKYWCMWSELPHEFWSFMTYLSFIMPYTRVNPPVLQLYEAIPFPIHLCRTIKIVWRYLNQNVIRLFEWEQLVFISKYSLQILYQKLTVYMCF